MIRLRTLGALDLRAAGGEEVRAVLAQPRRIALLAYLALAAPRGAHRRDKILAIFWPELTTDRARNALGQAVHFLRRSIGADAVVNRNGDGLSINWSGFWCDAAAFDDALGANRIAEAIPLYRGDLLEGFHIDDAPDFERWLDAERARLAERYTKAVETLATERENAKDFHGAAAHWRLLLARDPFSSRLTLRLMRALKAAGDPAEAIVQAHQHERLLRQEFGIAPDAEIAALIRELQSEHPQILVEARPDRLPALPKHAGGIHQGTKDLPPDIVSPRRRTATFRVIAASVVIAASAVLKGDFIDPPIPPSLAAQTGGERDIVSRETYLANLYVRGRNAEISRSEAGLATARQAYQLAIARDSTFVLGYAGMAGIYSLLGEYGFAPRLPAFDSARMMARRALVLDSARSETHAAYAWTLGNAGDFKAAEREFKKATELNPRDARAHYFYSVLLVALGRGEDAKREAERAEELDPLSPKTLAMRRHAQYLITGERPFLKLPPKERRAILKIEPNEPWALARQAEDLAQAGECEDARSDIERAQRLAPNNVRMRPFMARVDWWCGDRVRARALLDDMKRRHDVGDYAFDVALMHTEFGEKDSAFVWLERHDRWTVTELALLSASYSVDALRSDPRFLRLQRRLGVRE
jgi:DNA-binding SARP family transcriptional activator/Tfp pilus assembly protein PilF